MTSLVEFPLNGDNEFLVDEEEAERSTIHADELSYIFKKCRLG
jgi:hypothetical protein